MSGFYRETPMYHTRFDGLGYQMQGRGNWRFVDLASGGHSVGASYHSKDELLADLTRYATEYGCEQVA